MREEVPSFEKVHAARAGDRPAPWRWRADAGRARASRQTGEDAPAAGALRTLLGLPALAFRHRPKGARKLSPDLGAQPPGWDPGRCPLESKAAKTRDL